MVCLVNEQREIAPKYYFWWPQHWKRSVFTPNPKKGNAKEGSNYCTIAVISHASKVMIKILQAMYKLDSQKAKEPEIKWPTFVGS